LHASNIRSSGACWDTPTEEDVASSKSSTSSSIVRPWEHNWQVAIIIEVCSGLFVMNGAMLFEIYFLRLAEAMAKLA
jgi:hypothetical protein